MIVNVVIIAALTALIGWAVWRAVRRARRGGGCCGEREQGPAKVRAADRNRAHYPYAVTLDIGGMTCENCARRVENALNGMEDTWASVDIGSRRATVRCKQPPDAAKLRAAVRQAGYEVLSQK